jgi:hypothetical protein
VLFLLFAVNQMQMLLLSSALLIFSTFMAIGLIARLFGITRSFGGAMIAFALGVGVLYPLMVCLTYGFLNTGLQEVVSSYCLPAIGCLLKVEQWSLLIFSFLSMLIYLMLGMTCPTVQAACTIQTYLPQLLGQLVTYGGIMSIGLTLVPFFNFLIVDTFIVDFSRAFGERMDLLSLLGNLI